LGFIFVLTWRPNYLAPAEGSIKPVYFYLLWVTAYGILASILGARGVYVSEGPHIATGFLAPMDFSGFINRFLYVTGKYLQPRILNTFSFGRVFKRVLRWKLKGDLL